MTAVGPPQRFPPLIMSDIDAGHEVRGVANGISVFGIAGGARLTGDRPIKEVGGPETGTSFFKTSFIMLVRKVGDASSSTGCLQVCSPNNPYLQDRSTFF